MVGKPAKTPYELIVILTEMDKKIKIIEDVLNEDLDETFKKSVLVGVLDPMTRQHTALDQDEDFHDIEEHYPQVREQHGHQQALQHEEGRCHESRQH